MPINILVAIKRVPVPGAKFVLTDDEQAINTRNLGFATSPHEECAVEEAIRQVKAHEGASTVLTLGAEPAIEQLRAALAMGMDNAVLVETDDAQWGPQSTAKAITAAIQAHQAENGSFDILLFGHESADSGGYQVGIRVATALDLPVVTGIKSLEIDGDTAIVKRESGGTAEVFEVTLPAVFTVKEGINVPRYPTMPGRLKAKRATIAHYQAESSEDGLQKVRLMTPPDDGKQVDMLGEGVAAVPKIVELLKELKIGDL